jgi:Ca2+-transporting ATPase
MSLRPRPRGESLLTRRVLTTVGLVGLAITIGLLLLIQLGKHHFGDVHIGSSIAFTAFALCLIVAAFECRSETESVFAVSTFDSKQLNLVALGEFVLAVFTTQVDGMRRLLGTVEINMKQFAWALLTAVVLLLLWEAGKLLLRHGIASARPASS